MSLFYKYLKENTLLNELNKSMIPSLTKIQNNIKDYYYSDTNEEKKESLMLIQDELNNVINILNQLDYSYEPDGTEDVSEETFTNILIKYIDEISNLVSSFSEDRLESFNSQTRYVSDLIDTHMINLK